MTQETETTIITYFFKKSLCGMVLYARITRKDDTRKSILIKCNEEQAASFLLNFAKPKKNTK